MRNLLHDQVKYPFSPEVEQRWAALIAEEQLYRPSAGHGLGAVAAGA